MDAERSRRIEESKDENSDDNIQRRETYNRLVMVQEDLLKTIQRMKVGGKGEGRGEGRGEGGGSGKGEGHGGREGERDHPFTQYQVTPSTVCQDSIICIVVRTTLSLVPQPNFSSHLLSVSEILFFSRLTIPFFPFSFSPYLG